MHDLGRRLERARGRVQIGWSPEREQQVLRGLHRRRRRRAALRAGGAALSVLVLLAGAHRLWRHPEAGPAPQAVAARSQPGPAASVPALPEAPRRPADPAAPLETVATGNRAPAEPPLPRPIRRFGSRRTAQVAGGTWKALAHEGQFELAYEAAERSRQAEVVDEPADLLLLADVARLSRHPQEAVEPLTKLLRSHGDDPRAPLAAFTLGRVQLDDLGRPRAAAESFRRAQELAPEGPMAQDALAREVEAWSRAGEGQRARARAEEYLRRYPDGRRLRSVRRYGALD